MAAVLNLTEITSESIKAVLSGLDESYSGTVRNIEWICKSSDDDAQSYVSTIPGGFGSVSHTFTGLSAGTKYTVTVRVSNISGSEDKEWSRSASTLSESSWYEVTAVEHYGGIKYHVKFTGLRAESGDTVYCTLNYSGKQSGSITLSDAADAPKSTFEKSGSIYPLPNGSYKISVYILNGSESEIYREREENILVTISSPKCSLKYVFEKREFSGTAENGAVYSYACESYPVIKASDAVSFQNDINTIRKAAGDTAYTFSAIKPGDAFKAEIFNEMYTAIYGISQGFTVFPEAFKHYSARNTITKAYLDSLSSVLQDAKDYYFSQKNT